MWNFYRSLKKGENSQIIFPKKEEGRLLSKDQAEYATTTKEEREVLVPAQTLREGEGVNFINILRAAFFVPKRYSKISPAKENWQISCL